VTGFLFGKDPENVESEFHTKMSFYLPSVIVTLNDGFSLATAE
jgi:hypothetical protein